MIGIIGAGLTGLTTAFYLKKDYVLFEKEDKVGGHSRTLNHNGFLYDFGGHFLHLRNDWVKKLVFDELGVSMNSHSRDSRIFLNYVYGKYPFQNNLKEYPTDIIIECVEGLAKAKYNNSNRLIETFEDYILATMGEGIAKHFMIPYNTKLWSIHPSEMTTNWMGRFIPEPQFTIALKNLVSDDSVIEGYNKDFFYPENGGIGTLCDAFGKRINSTKLNSDVASIDVNNKIINFSDGSNFSYSKLVNTMPLTELVLRTINIPDIVKEAGKKLNWTNITIYNIAVKGLNIDYNWVYVPEKKFPFFRFGNYSKVSPNKENPEINNLYIEFSGGKEFIQVPPEDELLIYLIEMKAVKPDAEIVDSLILPVKYAYIVYDKYREESVKIIQDYYKSKDIYSIGRFGNWEYSSMEDAIICGKEISELLNGAE
jgi:protoporphyrinogen oxidase